MSNLLAFIKSKQFLVHLALILVTFVILFFVLVKALASYTQHGDYVQVPDFKGIELNKLNDFVNDKEVAFEIIDSIYDPNQKPGIVLRQDPEANTNVKHNRTVYLYVTGMIAPQIIMPKLIDRSERQARLIINSYGLKVGKVTEKAADCNGCVIAQLQGGKSIEEGSSIKKGSIVDLVVGTKGGNYQSVVDTTKAEEPNFE